MQLLPWAAPRPHRRRSHGRCARAPRGRPCRRPPGRACRTAGGTPCARRRPASTARAGAGRSERNRAASALSELRAIVFKPGLHRQAMWAHTLVQKPHGFYCCNASLRYRLGVQRLPCSCACTERGSAMSTAVAAQGHPHSASYPTPAQRHVLQQSGNPHDLVVGDWRQNHQPHAIHTSACGPSR